MHQMVIAGFRHNHIFELFGKVAATADCAVTACCEEDPATRETLKSRPQCAGLPLYDHYSAMLQEVECDIVGIGDYYAKRGSLAIAALKAGKHVIADKPLCTSLAELAEIRRLAAERDLKVGLMLPLWSEGNTVAARDLIRDGKIGEVQAVSFNGQHPLNYGTRAGWYFEEGKQGGTINDIAAHGVDAVCFMTGMKFKSVAAARTWNGQFPQVPFFQNGGQFLAVLENGAGVTGDVSYFGRFALPSYWRFTVWGTDGWLEFSSHEPGVRYVSGASNELRHAFPAPAIPGYWPSFLDDIAGKPTAFNTEHVLEIAEWTLKIQEAADQSAH